MVTEPMYIQPNGRELPTQLGIYSDERIPGLRQLTDAVHAAGGLMMAHINHAGRAANPKLVPAEELVSASDTPCPANQVTPPAGPRRNRRGHCGFWRGRPKVARSGVRCA